MKQDRSGKKVTIHVRTPLKKRKTKKLALRKDGAAALNMKEEDDGDDSDTNALSTLSEEMSTRMSKLVKPMASLCSIHYVDFMNLVKEQKLSVEVI